jgi:hypothetical protein
MEHGTDGMNQSYSTALKITKGQFVPYKWISDKPLDYHLKAPYTINQQLK